MVLGRCERGFTSGYRQDVWVGQKTQEDKETQWWDDGVSNRVSKKHKLWKEWKQGKTSKEKYLEANKKRLRGLFRGPNVNQKAERKKFRSFLRRDYQKQKEKGQN